MTAAYVVSRAGQRAALAIFAKFGACGGAARIAGKLQAIATGLGALMNARGLMS